MARCKLIGVSKHMTSVLIKNEDGKMKQHRMIKGKEIYLDDSQLTFHTQRSINLKRIKLEMLEDEPVAPLPEVVAVVKEADPEPVGVETTEIDTELPEEPPKKKRGRRKKKEIIDESEKTDDTSSL